MTVEIGGDATKLGEAIEDSKNKSKSLQSELKQVEKLLKLDPKNVELAAQKQKILAEQVEETKKRLGGLMDKVLDNNATFKEMGLSLEESIALMAQFEQNGVNDSTALTAMKAAVKNAVKEGKPIM